MDPGRYARQQGWENNSALEGYGAVHDPNFRAGSYDDRRFVDDRFPRDTIYPRNAFHRDILERDNYPPAPAIGAWPQTRGRSYEDEYSIDKNPRRHEKPYVDSYQDLDSFHDSDKYSDIDTYQEYDKLRDGYRGIDNYRDQGIDRSARYMGRDREEYALDDYDHRPRISRQSREDSRERDYGRHSYDSDYDRGSRRDSNWKRHGSRDRDHDRDRSVLSRERDSSPYRMHERSRSRGHDDRLRSRSPEVEVTVVVIEKIAMMMLDMRGVINRRTEMRNGNMIIIMWLHPLLLL